MLIFILRDWATDIKDLGKLQKYVKKSSLLIWPRKSYRNRKQDGGGGGGSGRSPPPL